MCNNCWCVDVEPAKQLLSLPTKLPSEFIFGRNAYAAECHLHADFVHVQRQGNVCICCVYINKIIIIRLWARRWSDQYSSKLYATFYSRNFTHSHRSLLCFSFFVILLLFLFIVFGQNNAVDRVSYSGRHEKRTTCEAAAEKNAKKIAIDWADLQLTDFVTVVILLSVAAAHDTRFVFTRSAWERFFLILKIWFTD